LLELRPSRVWIVFLSALHLLALLAITIAAIPLIAKGLLVIVVLVSLIVHLKHSSQPVQLVWRTGNRWFINDDQSPAELHAVNFFSRWLVIITLLTEPTTAGLLSGLFKPRRKFIIPFDSLDVDTFRLLRVRLRIEGHELLNPPEETIK